MLNESLAYVTYRAYCWNAKVKPCSLETFKEIFADGVATDHAGANYDYRVTELAQITADYALR